MWRACRVFTDFVGQALNGLSFLSTFYWTEISHITQINYKGGWEIQFVCLGERETELGEHKGVSVT